jgi:hypothetical protein
MLNIVCLKWGNKFDHTFVNRLYTMCKKNFSVPFSFTCYTDNEDNIRKEVQCISMDPSYQLEKWWWKLLLFKTPPDDITIYLDLDIVIQNNIDHFIEYVQDDKLTTVKSYWKDFPDQVQPFPPEYDMDLNSSVIIWKDDLSSIWEEFIQDPDYYMVKYMGIDSYLYFNFKDKLEWIPERQVYSRIHGKNKWETNRAPHQPLFYDKSYNICIFNKYNKTIDLNKRFWIDDTAYEGFEHYWQD